MLKPLHHASAKPMPGPSQHSSIDSQYAPKRETKAEQLVASRTATCAAWIFGHTVHIAGGSATLASYGPPKGETPLVAAPAAQYWSVHCCAMMEAFSDAIEE